MYNRISVVIDNGDAQFFDVNQNDRVYMSQIVATDTRADNIFSVMAILAYAKVIGRNSVTYKVIEKWVDDHNIFVDAELPKVTPTEDTVGISSE